MEPKMSLKTPRHSHIVHDNKSSLSRPSTMQASWRVPKTLSTSNQKDVSWKDSRRPHTTGGDSRLTLKNASHSQNWKDGITPLRAKSKCSPQITQENWALSNLSRHETSNLDLRPQTTNSTTRVESKGRLSSTISRPHTAAGDSRTLRAMENILSSTLPSDLHSIPKLQSVKSYSSPSLNLEGLSPPESHKESFFDARSRKYPKTLKGPSQPSRVKPTHYLLDPSLNLRSPSVSNDFKVTGDNPMESLVTQMPLPPPSDSQSSSHSISPSTASRMLRKQIEAALRMYPRNTWGPVTKWGYQEDLPYGRQLEKDHFINNKEKLEKQRLESRKFGHQRHRFNYKSLTNFWDQNEAQQNTAYIDEKERFFTNSEKMLHAQNNERKARAQGIEKVEREKKRWREFERLEKREGEFIDKMESEQRIREDGRTKSNDSGVVYNIVTLEYPKNYAGDLLRFEDDQIRWRQCMRALRIQSKQSGARMYNVVSWKPHKPCCVPPLKPEPPKPPDPDLAPSPRKPKQPVPKNILHLEDKSDNVPIAPSNDLQTNW